MGKMNRFSEKYVISKDLDWEVLGGGVSRKFLGYDNQIMMVSVKFEEGALGAPHQHFHTQATYVVSGKFEFEIDGVKQIVEAGDGVYIEPNLLHSAVCLEEGQLIDTFSPVREDFLTGDGPSYFADKK
jgi:quercetin dioxygenase-like cupin family protein